MAHGDLHIHLCYDTTTIHLIAGVAVGAASAQRAPGPRRGAAAEAAERGHRQPVSQGVGSHRAQREPGAAALCLCVPLVTAQVRQGNVPQIMHCWTTAIHETCMLLVLRLVPSALRKVLHWWMQMLTTRRDACCRIGKQLQSELRGCRGDGTDGVSMGIAALVFDVCGVLKHFDQVCLRHCLNDFRSPRCTCLRLQKVSSAGREACEWLDAEVSCVTWSAGWAVFCAAPVAGRAARGVPPCR